MEEKIWKIESEAEMEMKNEMNKSKTQERMGERAAHTVSRNWVIQ